LYHVAKAQLALAQSDYDQAVSIANWLIGHMHSYGTLPFLPDILLAKGRAHLAKGEGRQAKEAFAEGVLHADVLGARRVQWRLLVAQAELEDDAQAAEALRLRAREIASYIAEHVGNDELRLHFMTLPAIRALQASRLTLHA
jgi:hypothetical protein